MYIGNFELDRGKVSIALMILFALIAMFFLGYQYSYSNAINYANIQIEESIEEFKADYNIKEDNFMFKNIEIPNFEVIDNGT